MKFYFSTKEVRFKLYISRLDFKKLVARLKKKKTIVRVLIRENDRNYDISMQNSSDVLRVLDILRS